jgi:nicotinamide riboside transporter PnuC
MNLFLQAVIVVCGLTAVILNIYKKRGCWPVWFVGNLFSVWLYLRLHIYFIIILQVVYNVTNVWGWIVWSRRKHG